jgi:SAM-dependent methyltransferase
LFRCVLCGYTYPLESWGPDLLPPSFESRYQSYATWRAVQEALSSWRKRTWDGTAQAQERSRSNERLADEFLERVAPAGRVLDIGCGNGWIAELCRDRDCESAGIDPMPSRPDFAFPFARAVSDCLPFEDGTFDCCIFLSSIDYSLSIEETLDEARRVLRQEGVLGIATPIHRTKEVDGERLHHYRFLSGELEALIAARFGVHPTTSWYQENYAFIVAHKTPSADSNNS